MESTSGLLAVLVGLASLVSVVVLVWQVHSAQASELMQFFAEYNDRYDRTMSPIPLSVFLDNQPSKLDEVESEIQRGRIERAVYEYFALCEEELNLFGKRSSRQTRHRFGHRKTWTSVRVEWESGITQNMRLALFQDCWQNFDRRYAEISPSGSKFNSTVQFSELRFFLKKEGKAGISDASNHVGSSD